MGVEGEIPVPMDHIMKNNDTEYNTQKRNFYVYIPLKCKHTISHITILHGLSFKDSFVW